jgi:hypothetical protein
VGGEGTNWIEVLARWLARGRVWGVSSEEELVVMEKVGKKRGDRL